MVFDKTGSLAATKRHHYLPFGEELLQVWGGCSTTLGYTADTIRQKFTGYERDNETGLDYAQARYCSSIQGRFTSPDPLMASAQATDQSLNRYSYVSNNPMVFSDPSGMQRGPGSFYSNNNPEISHAQEVGAGEVEAAERAITRIGSLVNTIQSW